MGGEGCPWDPSVFYEQFQLFQTKTNGCESSSACSLLSLAALPGWRFPQ